MRNDNYLPIEFLQSLISRNDEDRDGSENFEEELGHNIPNINKYFVEHSVNGAVYSELVVFLVDDLAILHCRIIDKALGRKVPSYTAWIPSLEWLLNMKKNYGRLLDRISVIVSTVNAIFEKIKDQNLCDRISFLVGYLTKNGYML